jgi:hypothetical protein
MQSVNASTVCVDQDWRLVELTLSRQAVDGLFALGWLRDKHRGDRERLTAALVKFCGLALLGLRWAPSSSARRRRSGREIPTPISMSISVSAPLRRNLRQLAAECRTVVYLPP